MKERLKELHPEWYQAVTKKAAVPGGGSITSLEVNPTMKGTQNATFQYAIKLMKEQNISPEEAINASNQITNRALSRPKPQTIQPKAQMQTIVVPKIERKDFIEGKRYQKGGVTYIYRNGILKPL